MNIAKIDKLEVECGKKFINIDSRGYDVINQVFFVCESVCLRNRFGKEERIYKEKKTFNDFDSYYNYLDGDIYENACYYQYDFSKIKKKIDYKKLQKRKSLIEYSIDDCKITPSLEEKVHFQKGEKVKIHVREWVNKFVECDTYEKFCDTVYLYSQTDLNNDYRIDITFFFWQYIFYDLNDKNRFSVIMKYMSTGNYPENRMIHALCQVYNPDDVIALYNYSAGEKQNQNKHKRNLKAYVSQLKNGDFQNEVNEKIYFDEKTHYYCERKNYCIYHYFETFEKLLKYRNYNLENTDLSNDIMLNYDFSKCKMNEATILPIGSECELKCYTKKIYENRKFMVVQKWYNSFDILVKQMTHEFDYFFDFVAFLKGDLSDADLLHCEGLKYLKEVSEINFTNAIIKSSICDKLGIKYEPYYLEKDKEESFPLTKENERITKLELKSSRELYTENEIYEIKETNYCKEKVFYISDIHLIHKLLNFGVKSQADVLYVVQLIVNNIVKEISGTVLIGGDISSDFEVFEIFVKTLRKKLDKEGKYSHVIFILGNHELWTFHNKSFDYIVKKYSSLLEKYGMDLLQNDILFFDSEIGMRRITEKEIMAFGDDTLRKKVAKARIIFFGGLAFSGYNEQFNANSGIYRNVINRKMEIEESKKFENLYFKIVSSIPDKRVIVFTHMPMKSWSKQTYYQKKYVYVSGHTHRNYFYDDGETRIYADNQIGYENENPHMKYFDINNDYDCFCDYADGIYQITKEEYINFYRGKNLFITYNREVNILYMLKKNGYYCFIHQSKGGSLTILNGGNLKKLYNREINYYYNNMDRVIALIEKPLHTYTKIQQKVAGEIKKLGGSGDIHGCIIDIDLYNHVYVNPVDIKLTGYWASDMVHKKIYPSVADLLKKKSPAMYARYTKLIGKSEKELFFLEKNQKIIFQYFHKYIWTQTYIKLHEKLKKCKN